MSGMIIKVIWLSISQVFSAMIADDTDMMCNILPWECLARLSHWLCAVLKTIVVTSSPSYSTKQTRM